MLRGFSDPPSPTAPTCALPPSQLCNAYGPSNTHALVADPSRIRFQGCPFQPISGLPLPLISQPPHPPPQIIPQPSTPTLHPRKKRTHQPLHIPSHPYHAPPPSTGGFNAPATSPPSHTTPPHCPLPSRLYTALTALHPGASRKSDRNANMVFVKSVCPIGVPSFPPPPPPPASPICRRTRPSAACRWGKQCRRGAEESPNSDRPASINRPTALNHPEASWRLRARAGLGLVWGWTGVGLDFGVTFSITFSAPLYLYLPVACNC